jgi:four helix bundle protein
MALQFDHEKLDVYQAGIAFNALVYRMSTRLRGSNRHVRDQLLRAALSIPLNIAEGNGKRPGADRRRYLETARGSAMECAAAVDVLGVTGACSEETKTECKALLVRIVSMLVRMAEPNTPMAREDGEEYGGECESNGGIV